MNDNTTKLPLWRNALDEMLAKGITSGSFWTAEFFEGHFKAKREDMRYSLNVSRVRAALRDHHGFYLNGRGQKGAGFMVYTAEQNFGQTRCYARGTTRQARNAFHLANGTRLAELTPKLRKRQEKQTEKMATRLVLLNRAGQVAALVEKHRPNLLKR